MCCHAEQSEKFHLNLRDSIDEYFENKEKQKSIKAQVKCTFDLRSKSYPPAYLPDYDFSAIDDENAGLPPATDRGINVDNSRKFLLWKMRNDISDKAVNELHHIDGSVSTLYKIRLIRNDLNKKICVIKIAHGAHIPMEDVIKT
ncbi:unnamed protein product [Didymodactylos carnosus]|uniref:Uncharacterized protein n=1 Tax=Didymodactylos carnosus TaxID=1234261 RepID=A0A8S2E2E0_9BILA|nr:unnamed protein product [Didymodactylos carnosus]CAF3818548.1 unnamed protein product [Didymodactylos carnosus]